jgi:hypothetical protein
MTAVYRFRQGIRSLLAFSQTVELPLAAEYLSPELLALFQKMRRSEQLHSLNVLREVLADGTTPHDLAVAALLHDVGKSRYPMRTWQKTLAVLTRAISPALFERWSRGNPAHIWHRPFVVYVQHPTWSAEMVMAAGASETAVWLIEHHQKPAAMWEHHPNAPLMRRLQVADNAN